MARSAASRAQRSGLGERLARRATPGHRARRRPARPSPRCPGSEPPRVERIDRLLVRRVEDGRIGAARLARRAWRAPPRGTPPDRGARRSRTAAAVQSSGLPTPPPGPASPVRARSAAACPAGRPGRSSSRRRTRPSSARSTADARPLDLVVPTPNSRWASITSSPLFTSVAEFVVTTRPCPRWVGERLGRGDIGECARVRPRNGPPDAVSTRRRTSPRPPERRPARSPSARSRPARSARARRAASPVRRRRSGSPCSRAPGCGRPRARRGWGRAHRSGDPVEHDIGLDIAHECSASSAPERGVLDPEGLGLRLHAARSVPAASPTTSKRRGLAPMTSSACVPIDPVDPRTMTRRIPSAYPEGESIRQGHSSARFAARAGHHYMRGAACWVARMSTTKTRVSPARSCSLLSAAP